MRRNDSMPRIWMEPEQGANDYLAVTCRGGVVIAAITLSLLGPVAPMRAQQAVRNAYPVLRLKPTAPRIAEECDCGTATERLHDRTAVYESKGQRNSGRVREEGTNGLGGLCSAHGFSSILVFWSGSERDPAEVAKWREADSTVIYDHFIRPVGRKFIMDHYKAYGGPKPPPVHHQGIESGGEKASVVL